MDEYGIASKSHRVWTNVSISSHVKFNRHLHEVNWRNVAKSTLPSMNKDRIDFVMSLCGAYSLNPLILITTVLADKDLAMTSTDREFNHRIRQIADDFARKHLEDGEAPTYATLDTTIRKVYDNDEYMIKKFLNAYSRLHVKHNVPLMERADSLVLMERDEDLRPMLLWPWREGTCWELGPTHGGSLENLTTYIPSAIDMGPTLYNDWNHNYEFLGMTGSVLSSHAGILKIHSTCNAEVVSGRYSTYYAHIKLLKGLDDGMAIKQSQMLGTIELSPNRALCLCDWEARSYSCSTGPHLHWEVRKDGLPESLNNMIVGGIRIKAGTFERDVTCTDPSHCMFAKDRYENNCATYFTDDRNNVFCPSVRGNTGEYFQLFYDPQRIINYRFIKVYTTFYSFMSMYILYRWQFQLR